MTLSRELESVLPFGAALRFGDLHLSRTTDGDFEGRHVDDVETRVGLEEFHSVAELREMAKFDPSGGYRPLKTAPTLKSGWITRTPSAAEFLKRLDAIYPASFATWIAYEKDAITPTSLRQTLDRQTGMYRFAGTITDEMAHRIMHELCAPGCIRKIAWPINDDCTVSRIEHDATSIPLICTEACTFAVSEARSLAKEAYDKAYAPVAPE